ncbi:hypothetical protein [Siminovitchia sp. FSL W7-1587]
MRQFLGTIASTIWIPLDNSAFLAAMAVVFDVIVVLIVSIVLTAIVVLVVTVAIVVVAAVVVVVAVDAAAVAVVDAVVKKNTKGPCISCAGTFFKKINIRNKFLYITLY